MIDSVIIFSVIIFSGPWQGLPATPTNDQILDNLILAPLASRFLKNIGPENSLGQGEVGGFTQ